MKDSKAEAERAVTAMEFAILLQDVPAAEGTLPLLDRVHHLTGLALLNGLEDLDVLDVLLMGHT